MLVVASTVKDTVPNLQRFVDRNLAAGIDHLVLFLDADLPDVDEAFADSAQVTCVRAWGARWWGDRDAPGLNTRQNLNASLVNALLARHGWGGWIFHLDADEVVDLDRDRLEALDPAVGAVRLQVLEAVSHEDVEAEGWFKRLLPRTDRERLVELGLLADLPNTTYFHGYVAGKSGWRPSLELRAGVHKPVDRHGTKVVGLEADWARVLHFDATSPEEFARKWRGFAASGLESMRFSRERQAIARDVAAVLARRLPPDEADGELRRIWERAVRDPFVELRELGHLERVDLAARRYEPREPDPVALRRLRAALAAAADVDRSGLLAGRPEGVLEAVEAAVGATGGR